MVRTGQLDEIQRDAGERKDALDEERKRFQLRKECRLQESQREAQLIKQQGQWEQELERIQTEARLAALELKK